MARRRGRHLYRGRGVRGGEEGAFERRYGERRGRYVYGATVGKVRRERTAERRVAEMAAHHHTHGHGRGHHGGSCGSMCRKGRSSHRHRVRRSRSHRRAY